MMRIKINIKLKKNSNFGIYDKFRKTIISEECFIKNYLNIYNLITTIEKKGILEKEIIK